MQSHKGVPVIAAAEVRDLVDTVDLIEPVRSALADFSRGLGESDVITFAPGGTDGDVHVKTAWLAGHEYFTVKVATWFTGRTATRGAPTDGYLAVHDAHTGELAAIILDEHHLTDVRTAAAGAVSITTLARGGYGSTGRVGVLGTGRQAYLQAVAAVEVTGLTHITLWGRDRARATRTADALARSLRGTSVEVAATAEEAVVSADIVITATASREAILRGAWLVPGQHVVAVGADDPTKRELDVECFRRADVVVVDSRRDTPRIAGDLRAAVEAGAVTPDDLVELGDVVGGRVPGRRRPEQVTIAKLIGLGVQDLAAAQVALRKLAERGQAAVSQDQQPEDRAGADPVHAHGHADRGSTDTGESRDTCR